MKLIFISDTHGEHKEIDSKLLHGDILIHCGDFMTHGTSMDEAKDFIDWFNELEGFQYKIFIAGNHDRLLEGDTQRKDILLNLLEDNVIYLEASEFILPNGLKIFGTPYQPALRDWAFNLPIDGNALKEKYYAIPDDTDILITHSPPYGVLDKIDSHILGSKILLERVQKIEPMIHAFGHIHECPGKEKIGSTLFINAAQLDRKYKVVNKPISIELDLENVFTSREVDDMVEIKRRPSKGDKKAKRRYNRYRKGGPKGHRKNTGSV